MQERAPIGGKTLESLKAGLVENRWNNLLHILLEDILVRMAALEQQRTVLVEENVAAFVRTVLSTCTSRSHGCVGVVVRLANHLKKDKALTTTDELWGEFEALGLEDINRRQNQVLGEGPEKEKEGRVEEDEAQWSAGQFWRREVSFEEEELEALMKDL